MMEFGWGNGLGSHHMTFNSRWCTVHSISPHSPYEVIAPGFGIKVWMLTRSTQEADQPRTPCGSEAMEADADQIALAVTTEFARLAPKRKPQVRSNGVREWTPLSGIVARGEPCVPRQSCIRVC